MPTARTLFRLPPLAIATALGGGCDDTQVFVVPEPDIQIDELQQQAEAEVDILWVIDNSGTMRQEQDLLGENFDRFIRGLTLCQGTGIDDDVCDFESKTCSVSGEACTPPSYRIGVTSTNLRSPEVDSQIRFAPGELHSVGVCVPAVGQVPANDAFRYCQSGNVDCAPDPDDPASDPANTVCDQSASLRFVTPTTPNGANAFNRAVRVGVTGGAQERGIQAAARALGLDVDRETGETIPMPDANTGFVRDSAALFVIFVSDEDDESFGLESHFYRLFETLKGPGNESLISMSAIVGDPDPDGEGPAAAGCGMPGEESFAGEGGDRYIGLSMYTRGISDELRVCDNTRLTCPDGTRCVQEIDSLPGVCIPSAECEDDAQCGTAACGDDLCVQCNPQSASCELNPESFLELLEVNGIYGSICSNDYGRVLDALGFQAAGLGRKFELSKFPDCVAPTRNLPECCPGDTACGETAPICVKVDGEVVPNDRQTGFIYETTSNAIFFDGELVPGPNASVTISYTVTPAEPNGCAGIVE